MNDKKSQENIDGQLIAEWLKDGFKLDSGNRGQMTGKHPRAKNYAFVVYPEELPDDWFETFSKLGFRLVLSPLHDKDVNPDGELKKSHYHMLMMGDRNWIKFQDIKDLVLHDFSGKGVAVPQKCSNVEGMVRYFIHLDNPEKYQYQKSDIKTFGKVDIEKYFELTESDKTLLVSEILDFIDTENIIESCHLIQYARLNNFEWFSYLSKNYYFVDKYITSKRNNYRQNN